VLKQPPARPTPQPA